MPHGDTRRSDKLYQLLWRPRPPSLLPEAKEKEIRKNLRDYSSKYEAEDAKLKTLLKGDELKARREKHRAFEEFLRLKARPRRDIAEILPRYRRSGRFRGLSDVSDVTPACLPRRRNTARRARSASSFAAASSRTTSLRIRSSRSRRRRSCRTRRRSSGRRRSRLETTETVAAWRERGRRLSVTFGMSRARGVYISLCGIAVKNHINTKRRRLRRRISSPH